MDPTPLLDELERESSRRLRRAAWQAWALIFVAALVFMVLIGFASRRLIEVRQEAALAETRAGVLKAEVGSLTTTRDALRKQVTALREEARNSQLLVENYKASLAPVEPPEPDPPPAVVGEKGRVYLHVVTREDQENADALLSVLSRAGFEAPRKSIRVLRAAGFLKNSEVRYYKKSDEPGANALVKVLKDVGITVGLLYLGLETNTAVRPNHYEIWFSAGNPPPRPRPDAEARIPPV